MYVSDEIVTTDLINSLVPLMLCCMIPMVFNKPKQPGREANESDSWYVTVRIEDMYDSIVKEVDGWREKIALKKPKGALSFLYGKTSKSFDVDVATPPRLYRLKDDQIGEISFELTEVQGGGTSIKATYDARARALMQNFKATLPIKIPSSGPKVVRPLRRGDLTRYFDAIEADIEPEGFQDYNRLKKALLT